MKNPYIIPAAMICAAILAGSWMLKSPSEQPQKVVIVQPPQPPATSIHDAAMDGDIEAVKQHLAGGADVNAKNVDGWTPLHEAAFGGRKEILELLISNGADVNAKHGNGYTPLHEAAYGGHKEIAELLIANGANVNAKTDGGFAKPIPKEGQLGLHLFILTPLDEAIRRKQTATADLLRKHGGKTYDELEAAGE